MLKKKCAADVSRTRRPTQALFSLMLALVTCASLIGLIPLGPIL